MNRVKRFFSRFGSWLNKKTNFIASEEESAIYSQIDNELRMKGQ